MSVPTEPVDVASYEDPEPPELGLEEELRGVTVTTPTGGEILLRQLVKDINVGHEELSQYRKAALAYRAELDEMIEDALEEGRTDRAQALQEVSDHVWDLYERLTYGDQTFYG